MERIKGWMIAGLRGFWTGLKKSAMFSWCCFAIASMQIGIQLFIMFVIFTMWAESHAGHPLTDDETWAVFDQVMTNVFILVIALGLGIALGTVSLDGCAK